MKKFACAALSTALLASMLAACGSSASTTPAASSADTSSDTGASSTEAAASTGAAADGSLHVAMNTDIQTVDFIDKEHIVGQQRLHGAAEYL